MASVVECARALQCEMRRPRVNEFVREATAYVEKNFANNPGSAASFSYPVTYEDARRWLQDFVTTRLLRT